MDTKNGSISRRGAIVKDFHSTSAHKHNGGALLMIASLLFLLFVALSLLVIASRVRPGLDERDVWMSASGLPPQT